MAGCERPHSVPEPTAVLTNISPKPRWNDAGFIQNDALAPWLSSRMAPPKFSEEGGGVSGRVPVPGATDVVRCAIDEALRCKKESKAETILLNLSGRGHFDMGACIAYFDGRLIDQDYDERELATALEQPASTWTRISCSSPSSRIGAFLKSPSQ
jgi:hypothetical protein